MVSELHYGPPPQETKDGPNSAWPCAVIMLICCLTFLGACFASVYFLINVPR